MQEHIDEICKRYGLIHGSNNNKIPIHDLFKDDFVVYEGHNRHEPLMRVMESMIKKNAKDLSFDTIMNFCRQWNQEHCRPPLDEEEFQKQWKCAEDFIIEQSGKGDDEPKKNKDLLMRQLVMCRMNIDSLQY